jgi:hypothetical protein
MASNNETDAAKMFPGLQVQEDERVRNSLKARASRMQPRSERFPQNTLPREKADCMKRNFKRLLIAICLFFVGCDAEGPLSKESLREKYSSTTFKRGNVTEFESEYQFLRPPLNSEVPAEIRGPLVSPGGLRAHVVIQSVPTEFSGVHWIGPRNPLLRALDATIGPGGSPYRLVVDNATSRRVRMVFPAGDSIPLGPRSHVVLHLPGSDVSILFIEEPYGEVIFGKKFFVSKVGCEGVHIYNLSGANKYRMELGSYSQR